MAHSSEYLNYEAQGMAAYQAPHLFQPSKVRQALRDAHEGRIPPLVAYFSAAPLSRTISQFGADIVLLDWEHAAMSVETVTTYCHEIQFMSGGRSVPVVRLPNHDHANIGWALDAGASIMVPQIETVEQAEKVVAATKFGTTSKHLARSAPPARFMVGVTDDAENASESFWYNQNRQAAVIIQMESVRGAENLDDILAAVGKDIDCVFLGSLDMRIDMGLEKGWGPEQSYLDIVEKLRATCKKHNVPFANPVLGGNWDRVEGRAFGSVGFDLMTLWQDRNKVQEARKVFKNHLAEKQNKVQTNDAEKSYADMTNVAQPDTDSLRVQKTNGEIMKVAEVNDESHNGSNGYLNGDRLVQGANSLIHVH